MGALGIILPRLYQIHFHQIRETQAALNQTEDLFEQVMEQLPTIFWTKDLNGRYTRVNRMGLDFMSMVSEGILGRTCSEIHQDPDKAARLQKQDEEVIRTKKTLRVPREQFLSVDGEDRWAIAIKAPILNKEGEVQETMGISTDITELVLRERELEKSFTGEAQQSIARLRRKVDRNMDQGESWLNFKLYFEWVHPDFFDKLTAACPKLSTNELKHCAYIRMNMAPNEVAEMLFVERKTVEVSRYRVKKKLGLGKGVSLIEHIRGI